MPKRRKKLYWSYNAGERGRNWARSHCKGCGKPCRNAVHHPGGLYVEWMEPDERKGLKPDGTPHMRKASKKLRQEGGRGVVTDIHTAKARADELAARFAETAPASTAGTPLSVLSMMDRYVKEVTPTKGGSKQSHDRRAHRVFVAFFNSQPEPGRHAGRHPGTLDRLDWDRFVVHRSAGSIPGWPQPCRNTQIAYDLKWLIAVLNWALGASLLEANPWGAEVRRVHRWEMPRELNPARPGMPDDIRDGLVAHAPGWQFAAVLEFGRETRSRNSSVRQLLWSDIDQEEWTVHWREETDKVGREALNALTPRAIEILKALPSRAIGDVPVFPSATNPMEPTPAETFQTWLQRAKNRWLDATPAPQKKRLRARLARVGFHSEKRTGVRDARFRALPPAIQERWSRTRWTTLNAVYDEITVEDMREAMEGTPEWTDSGSNCDHQLRAGGAEARG